VPGAGDEAYVELVNGDWGLETEDGKLAHQSIFINTIYLVELTLIDKLNQKESIS
jgi:hypothetical protein